MVPELALSESFVLAEISFKPSDVAVAFEGKNMCCYSVEEPTIMTYDYGAARECLKAAFQCSQRINI